MSTDQSQIKEDYISRINKALRFIDDHLDSELSLDTVAGIASYSPFHFHRIFKAVVNETLNSYVIRRRIEKTATLLIRNKEVTITELSLQYGFNSNSSFTRAFKKFYGISPSEFRKLSPGKYSKICQLKSKNGQENQIFEEYICNITNLKNWMEMNATIEIKETPELSAMYISQIGVNGIENAFEKLIRWGTPKRLFEDPNTKMARVFHDSFKITSPDKVRMSICMILSTPYEAEGEIGSTTIKKGKHLVGHYEIAINDFEKAWSSLFIWMNENGYKKAEQDPFEIYHNNFNDHPEKKFIVDFYIPIV